GGNNVHATDIEETLLEHPAVMEAAVAGVPHDVLGEDVAAWVVLAPEARVTPAELLAFMSEHLSDYKVPRRYTFVDELPRNATGKVVKHELPPAAEPLTRQ
ncbi:MAG: AMP-binding enzyme, partial [Acidimicrobiales bacterium]